MDKICPKQITILFIPNKVVFKGESRMHFATRRLKIESGRLDILNDDRAVN